MSAKSQKEKKKKPKPLLPLEKRTFSEEPPLSIALEDIVCMLVPEPEPEPSQVSIEQDTSETEPVSIKQDTSETEPVSIEQDTSETEPVSAAVLHTPTVAMPLPELYPIDDDELPFIEQPYTPISEDDLAQLSLQGSDAEEWREQGTTEENNGTERLPENIPDVPPLPKLQPMDEDELPFIEQPYMPISLDELKGTSDND